MHLFKVGDLVHFTIHSDTTPGVVKEVSKNGKTVKVRVIDTRLKTTSYGNHVYQEDLIDYTESSSALMIFKSRLDKPHKEPFAHGATLHHGFLEYREISD